MEIEKEYSEYRVIDILKKYRNRIDEGLFMDYVMACDFAVQWHYNWRVAINSKKRDFDWEDHTMEEYSKYKNKEQEALANIFKYMLDHDVGAAKRMYKEIFRPQYDLKY